jgi:hypothetical protein
VRLVERAGVVEVAVRADASAARGWLTEGLPGLVEGLRERGFEVNQPLQDQTGLKWWSQDRQGSRHQREGEKHRASHQRTVFTLESGEPS